MENARLKEENERLKKQHQDDNEFYETMSKLQFWTPPAQEYLELKLQIIELIRENSILKYINEHSYEKEKDPNQ